MNESYEKFCKDYPISLKSCQDLISRVHYRYPKLSKDQIALIIKYFFLIIRKELLFGSIINISGLFNNFSLIRFSRKNYNVIKARLKTPRYFRFLE